MQLRQGRHLARVLSQALLWKQRDPGPHKQEAGVSLPAAKEISMGANIVLAKIKTCCYFLHQEKNFPSTENMFCFHSGDFLRDVLLGGSTWKLRSDRLPRV